MRAVSIAGCHRVDRSVSRRWPDASTQNSGIR
jgi:hypothetical protein